MVFGDPNFWGSTKTIGNWIFGGQLIVHSFCMFLLMFFVCPCFLVKVDEISACAPPLSAVDCDKPDFFKYSSNDVCSAQTLKSFKHFKTNVYYIIYIYIIK